jgi:hypothetical protein
VNTFQHIQPQEGTPSYIDEKLRFSNEPRNSFLLKEKSHKLAVMSKKLENIREHLFEIKENNTIKDKVKDKKDMSGLIYRTKNMFTYENVNYLYFIF